MRKANPSRGRRGAPSTGVGVAQPASALGVRHELSLKWTRRSPARARRPPPAPPHRRGGRRARRSRGGRRRGTRGGRRRGDGPSDRGRRVEPVPDPPPTRASRAAGSSPRRSRTPAGGPGGSPGTPKGTTAMGSAASGSSCPRSAMPPSQRSRWRSEAHHGSRPPRGARRRRRRRSPAAAPESAAAGPRALEHLDDRRVVEVDREPDAEPGDPGQQPRRQQLGDDDVVARGGADSAS